VSDAFNVTETVVSEYASIRDDGRRRLHDEFVAALFLEPEVRSRATVNARVAQLLQFHDDESDRRILAEAEDLDLDALLTYDRKFLKNLRSRSQRVVLLTPTEHWKALSIPIGTPPVYVPHPTNPLSQQSWWRW
jgi:predicted nucleic acid-binding protein